LPDGRPSIYCPEMVERIITKISTCTDSLHKLCKENEDLPNKDTIYAWRIKHPEFSDLFLQARRNQAHFLAEELKHLSEEAASYIFEDEKGQKKIDAGIIAMHKLKIHANTWLASRFEPMLYGDKQQTNVTIKHEEKLQDLE
jgi:hypothetical protein